MKYMEHDSDNELDLFTQLAKLQWLMRRSFMMHSGGHGPMNDPHRGQGRILALLKMQPEITQKELSYLLDMRPQSLGEFLLKLEKNGYITRTPSEKDRRIVEIKLTDKGLAETERALDRNDAFRCLTEEEQQQFNAFIERIMASLREKLGMDTEASEQEWKKREEMRFGHGGPHGCGGPHGGDTAEWSRKFEKMQRKFREFGMGFPPEGDEPQDDPR